MAQEIKLRLTIDGKEAIATLDQAQLGLDQTDEKGKNVNSTFAQIKNTAVGNFLAQQFTNAVSSLKQLISESQELAATQERQEAKIEQLVKVTGGAAGFSAEQLKEQAAQLQTVTTTGDETILSIQSKLLTFKSVQGDIFEGLVELALDTGELFGSAESAILQYGKAFEDPARNLSQLRRVGITFSEEQEKQIKNLQENNQLVEAQNVLMGVLKGQLGGVAKAMAETDSGKIQQFNNRLGDTQEKVGAVLQKMKVEMIPVWDSLLDVTNRLITVEKSQVEILQEEQFEINRLVNEIRFLNPESEERNQLINKLNELYPNVLENIESEVISNQDLSEAIKEVNKQKAGQILAEQQLLPVRNALAIAEKSNQGLENERAKLIKALTDLENDYAVTLEDLGGSFDKHNGDLNKLNQTLQIFSVAVTKNISLEEAELRLKNSFSNTLNNQNIAVADNERARRKLNQAIAESETFLLAAGFSQERVNDLLKQYKDYLNDTTDGAVESNEAINKNAAEIAGLKDQYQQLLNTVASESELEVLRKNIEDLGGSVGDLTPEFKTFSDLLDPLQERLKTLKDIQGPTEAQQAEIEQLQLKIDKLKEQKEAQEALRTGSFRPGAGEAPEDVVIEDDPGEFTPVELDTDPMVAQYNERQLAAMELWELQNHLYDLEQAAAETTSQAKQDALQGEIEATLNAMAVEQNRIQAQRAIGESIANQILYAKTVKEGTKNALKAISAEISALFIRNALLTAGASGPLALIVAPGLIALAKALSDKVIDSLPGFELGGKVKGGKQMIVVNEAGEETIINAPSTNIAEEVLQFINSSPANAAVVQDTYNNVIKNNYNNIEAFAEGGQFETDGPQLILVGDNPGGRERVEITPISSDNKFGPSEQKAPNVNVNVTNNVEFKASVRELKDKIDELIEIEQAVGN